MYRPQYLDKSFDLIKFYGGSDQTPALVIRRMANSNGYKRKECYEVKKLYGRRKPRA